MKINSKPWISARRAIVMAEYNEISDEISEKASDILQPIGMFEIKIFCIKQTQERIHDYSE